MAARTRNIAVCGSAALALVVAASATWAGSPVELTNNQLDRITAGGAAVSSSATSQAAGVLALTGTTVNSMVAGGTSPNAQPGFATTAGAADGTSVAVGTNIGVQNAPPPSSSTSVTTSGTSQGNQVIISTVNHTVQGVGGVTFQAGWTFVYGAWVGL